MSYLDLETDQKKEKQTTGGSNLRLMLIPGITLIFVSFIAIRNASHGTSIFLAHFLTSQVCLVCSSSIAVIKEIN